MNKLDQWLPLSNSIVGVILFVQVDGTTDSDLSRTDADVSITASIITYCPFHILVSFTSPNIFSSDQLEERSCQLWASYTYQTLKVKKDVKSKKACIQMMESNELCLMTICIEELVPTQLFR